MSEHRANVRWQRGDQAFVDKRYSRAHVWEFDGGVRVTASASPHVVPAPLSIEAAVDPEEAFVASLSSCHMLCFLSIAAQRGFRVDEYRDEAVGTLGRNPEGRLAILSVVLRPRVSFSGATPSEEQTAQMHHQAHEECFLAASVKTEVRCEWVRERRLA